MAERKKRDKPKNDIRMGTRTRSHLSGVRERTKGREETLGSGHKIDIFLLITVIRYSSAILVSNGHVLESKRNGK
jgi:hypothetical protein